MSKIMVEGTGLTIALSASSLTFKPISLNLPEISYEMLKDTDLENTTVETFIRSTLASIGELSFEAYLDLEQMYAPTAANEQITVSLPTKSGTPATFSAWGCISKRSSSSAQHKERSTMTVAIAFTNRNAEGTETAPNVA